MVDLVEVAKVLCEDNPNLEIHSITNANGLVNVIILYENNYYELCHIDLNKDKVYENKFLVLYNDFIVNEKKILEQIKKSYQ